MESNATPPRFEHPAHALGSFRPRHDLLVGFDSDGCVLDTMASKQRDYFHPLIIRCWGLESIAPAVREVAEFVTLASRWRGANRFLALLKIFDELAARPEARGVAMPSTHALRRYLQSGQPLGHPTLIAELERHPDPALQKVLDWSLAVNREIDDRMPLPQVFPGAAEALQRVAREADAVVLSQTPQDRLVTEWRHQGLDAHVSLFVGQEAGSKAEQLGSLTRGRYRAGRVLMIGDAPGDLEAAREAGAWFYPILPNREAESWSRFNGESFERFVQGAFDDSYQHELARCFQASLPDAPPWSAARP